MDDYDYMKIALMEARKAYRNGEVPVGAVLVQNNKILAKLIIIKKKRNVHWNMLNLL